MAIKTTSLYQKIKPHSNITIPEAKLNYFLACIYRQRSYSGLVHRQTSADTDETIHSRDQRRSFLTISLLGMNPVNAEAWAPVRRSEHRGLSRHVNVKQQHAICSTGQPTVCVCAGDANLNRFVNSVWMVSERRSFQSFRHLVWSTRILKSGTCEVVDKFHDVGDEKQIFICWSHHVGRSKCNA